MEKDQELQEREERSGVMGGVAGVLNAGGSAMVYAYDVTSGAIGKLFTVVRKAPVIPTKAFDMVAGGLGIVKPAASRKIEDRIKAYEKKIKGLYYEIGKEGSKYKDLEDPLQTEPVQKLISDVREYEKEIQRLQGRIMELKEEQKEKALQRSRKKAAAQMAAQKVRVSDQKVLKSLADTIEKAVKHGVFESSSESAIFDKVATDLLDSEVEIKTLAAAELGKMGKKAAVPILIEAAGFDLPDLTSEIINSLISIGATEAISLFKEKMNDPKYRVRIGCLRGLFKLASDDEAIPLLTAALRDEHPEVRRSAATFLGWKDCADAVPALVQCLSDKEAKVRKSAVSALANIKDLASVPPLFRALGDKDLEIREKALEAIRVISGEEIAFDLHASGNELNKAIDDLRAWWQDKRLGELDVTEPEAPAGEPEDFAPEPQVPDPDAEAAILAEAPEEHWETAEPEAETVSSEGQPHTEQSLMKMLKSELLSLCNELGIEGDEGLTKAQIAERILEASQ